MKSLAPETKIINYEKLQETIGALVKERSAETYIGSMMTTQGLFILLFSHRYNEEHGLLVRGTDTSKIMTRVFEILAERGGVS